MVRLEMKNCNMILTEKQQKFQHCLKKIDKYEYLTGEEILSSNQRQTIEQAKFVYSIFGKAFEKQKQLKSKEKKQIKSLEKHGKQLVQSNELIKKDFNIDKDGIPLGKQ